MGQQSESGGTLYLDGVPIMAGVIHEITVSEDALTPEAMSLLQPMEFTAHVKTPKRWRCQSRKRFIKLMMGEGWPRNAAEDLAYLIRRFEIPYSEAWKSRLWTSFARKAYENRPN